jgi:undecaprenyl pyrophosphate phosphatase UppP
MNDVILILVVQVIMESFPVSSTGHMVLAQHFWTRFTGNFLTDLPEYFDHFLHGPTIIILMTVFFYSWARPLGRLLVGWWLMVAGGRELTWQVRRLTSIFIKLAGLVMAADVMTLGCYAIRKLFLKKTCILSNPMVVFCGLCITTVVLFSLYFKERQICRPAALTWWRAVLLGICQGISLLLPGCSRFAGTYVVGRWLNLSRRRALEFSFLIQFPLIFAAFFVNGVPVIIRMPAIPGITGAQFLMAMAGATLVAGGMFFWVYGLALRGTLWRFGWYMLLPLGLMGLVVSG